MVIQLNPDDTNAYSNRGAVFVSKGDYDRAIADFTKAIELDPNNTNAHKNLRTAKLHRA